MPGSISSRLVATNMVGSNQDIVQYILYLPNGQTQGILETPQGGGTLTFDALGTNGGVPPTLGQYRLLARVYRSSRIESQREVLFQIINTCNFTTSVSVSNANPGCNASITFSAGCTGSNCEGVDYDWSGPGVNQNGQSITINAPTTNGSFGYAVSATKPGCPTQTVPATINVSGCGQGTPNPGNGCAAFTNGQAVAQITGNAGAQVIVSINGTCSQAIWSTGWGVVHPDWITGNGLTFLSGFTRESIQQCLNFDGQDCTRRLARLGADEPSANGELLAYPNPTDAVLTVELAHPLPAEPVFILTDVLGRTQAVAAQLTIINERSLRLVVSQLATGHYVLRVTGGTETGQTIRFVKQ